MSSSWLLAGAALALGCALSAAAQPAGQPQSSGAMTGLSANRDQPVKIESNTLELRDKIGQATFSGDVKLVQGDTTIKCKVLVVFYEDAPPPAPKKGQPAQAQQKGGQQIKRAEAKGDVFIVQKDQTASGENGVFDMKSNTFVMTGNVVVTQGASVTRGERMVVNLTSGVTNVESAKGTGGRVEFMTQPGAAKDAKGTPQPPAQPAAHPPAAAPPSAKVAPKGPMRIN
jgi:lipopolysaccharide export system protein LptA